MTDEEIIVISSDDELGEPDHSRSKRLKIIEDKMKAEIMAEEDRRIFEILDSLG